jgi:hypothetical protein
MFIALIPLLITGVAALVPAISLYLQNAQLKRELKRETEYKRNAADHGFAVSCILSIGRRWIIPSGDRAQGSAFDLVFPNEDLRRRIAIYLGTRNFVGDFSSYQLTADQLSNPECCRTICDVIDAVAQARHEEWADKLQLPRKS